MALFNLKQQQDKVILDFVGANVAKKLHAGHMRNLNIGESLRRILKLKYPNLITDNHWGDWGVNMGILLWGWKETGNFDNYQQNPIEELTRVYVWANEQEKIVPNWDLLVREEFLKLEQKDVDNYKLWQEFIIKTKQDLEQDLELMKVTPLDLDQGESFYEQDMQKLTAFLEKYNLWQKDGRARFFDFENLSQVWTNIDNEFRNKISNLGRCYLISSNGYTSYCYRDVAARWQWARDHKAELMISITDKTQQHNFDQAFVIISYLASLPEFQVLNTPETIARLEFKNLVHVGYGFLTLKDGKMSTRKGNVLTLKSLFEEVCAVAIQNLQQKSSDLENVEQEFRAKKIALAALKWYDLNRSASENLVLNIPEILNFVGNTGVYQLYTFARIKNILKKCQAENSQILEIENNSLNNDFDSNFDGNSKKTNPENNDKINFTADFNLLNAEEKIILKKLYLTDFVLEKICQNFKPHLLCTHLYELCTLINAWYGNNSVSGETDPIRQQTLLVLCTKITIYLRESLNLLGIEVLDDL